MNAGNGVMPGTDIGAFETRLSEVDPQIDPVEQAERVLDNTAFYDFNFYEFLFPTETGYRGRLSEQALATVDDFQAEASVVVAHDDDLGGAEGDRELAGAELATLMLDVLARVEQAVREQVIRLRRRDWDQEQVVQDLLDDYYRARASVLPPVLGAYHLEIEQGIGGLFLQFIGELTATYLLRHIYQAYPSFFAFWAAWPAFFEGEFPLWHDAVNPVPPPPTAPVPTTPGTPVRGPTEEHVGTGRPDLNEPQRHVN